MKVLNNSTVTTAQLATHVDGTSILQNILKLLPTLYQEPIQGMGSTLSPPLLHPPSPPKKESPL